MTAAANLRTLGPLEPIDRSLLAGPAVETAQRLLGMVVTSTIDGAVVSARIVETEAYRQDDPASHSYRGRTPRTEPMFGPPGLSYVYFTYGMHHCMNVSCEPDGIGAAVLLRAGVILEGLPGARARRKDTRDRDLARGPARLAQALGVDRRHSGLDLLDPASDVRLQSDGWRPDPSAILHGPRTGVRQAADRPWRCWVDDVAEVSPHRRHPKSAHAGPDRP